MIDWNCSLIEQPTFTLASDKTQKRACFYNASLMATLEIEQVSHVDR